MKRPNITPGEWNTHLGILKSSQEEQLADLRVPVSPFTSLPEKEVREANARAIAAVPALLAALENLYSLAAIQLNQGANMDGLTNCEALAKSKEALIQAGYTF